MNENYMAFCRSTPIETLHTILLGPYKYLTRQLMKRITAKEKKEIKARVIAFQTSGFEFHLSPSVCKVYGSFFGRDFKVLAQMCLFLIWDYLTSSEQKVWLALSKVVSEFNTKHLATNVLMCVDF